MKQKVELFIDNQQLDVFTDGSITIQSSIKDAKDPSKIFTDFSKNFTLPASDRNNKFFQHYYNYAIDGFDANNAKEARIEINSRVYKEGYITLQGVNLKFNKPYAYKVTFYGNLRFLREKLSNTKLSELVFLKNFYMEYKATGTDSVYDFLTTSKNITDEKGTSHTQPLVVPLITHTERLYIDSSPDFYGVKADGNLFKNGSYPVSSKRNGVSWDQLKPAIRIDIIIKAIEKLLSEEGETVNFSTDFFNTNNLDYYNLYMWLHQKEGKIVSREEDGKVTTLLNKFSIGESISYVSGTNAIGFKANFINSSGVASGAAADKVKITIPNGRVDNVIGRLSLVSSDTSTKYDVRINRDGVLYDEFTQQVQTGTTDYIEFNLDEGTYTFTIITDSGSPIDFNSGFELRLIARVDREFEINVPDITRTATTLTTNSTGIFYTHENMPDMSVLDFLSSIFKMFNLVAEVRNDSSTQKTIVVKTLDDFYTSSTIETDITNKIDISSSSVESTLPYSKLKFEYEDLGSLLAKQHQEANGIAWGGEATAEYKGDTRNKQEYIIKPGFGHMKFERLYNSTTSSWSTTQVGFSVTKSNEDDSAGTQEQYNPYIGKPVLFYPILLTSATDIPYVYNDRAAHYSGSTTSYFIPSNAVSTDISKTNHFGIENNEYDAANNDTQGYTQNLFSEYYSNYVSSIFNKFNRLTKLKAVLTNAFITSYSLADTIVVSGEKYNINKINLDIVTGKADLELISTYAVLSELCLNSLFEVRIEAITGGYLYIFDNKYSAYQVANGTYTFSNVPAAHPIAFHNFGKDSLISYTGTTAGGTKSGLDGNTYTYYYGDITLTVNGDFGTISYECFHHGYMGGQNNFSYNSNCSVAPTPTPTPGNLTVDTTYETVDSALITADQTDE